MRVLFLLIFLVSCGGPRQAPMTVAKNSPTTASENFSKIDNASVTDTGSIERPSGDDKKDLADSSTIPANVASQPAEQKDPSETVVAPTNINGAYLRCVIDDDRVPNGVAVDCRLLSKDNKPLAPESLDLKVEYSVELVAGSTAQVSINSHDSSTDRAVEFIIESGTGKQSMNDVIAATFRANVTSQSSDQSLGSVFTKGQDVFTEFAKSIAGSIIGGIFPGSTLP